jgi:DNA-binding NarL/FixJ family response regulator
MIDVIIADDHPIVLAGLTQLIRQEAGMRVVATCVNGLEALEATRAQRPHILLLDLKMPKLDGLRVLRALAAERIVVGTIILTAEADETEVSAVRAAGARGIVLKELSPHHVTDSIRRAHSGAEWVEFLGRSGKNTAVRSDEDESLGLTPRELELATLVTSGLRNRDVAIRLGISEGTAKLHLYNVYKKLDVANRVELVLRMRRAGLLGG